MYPFRPRADGPRPGIIALMPRRVLILLSQLPHDPTSGAARSIEGIGRELAAHGFAVRTLATTATEGGLPHVGPGFLASLGFRVETDRRAAIGSGRAVYRFDAAGVKTTLLDTAGLAPNAWDFQHGTQFNRLLLRELESHPPDVVLTFGGAPADQARRQIVRASGAAIVFSLMNLSYLHPLAFDGVDAVITPSAFLSRLYADRIGLISTPLPDPIDPGDAIATSPTPTYFTFVNPTPAKGVFFFAALADQLARRADIPLQVIEARGKGQHLIQAGLNGGIDLRAHPNLRIVPARPRPRDVFADCKALLMPSVWDEPAGRLAAEALLNGLPALVSDRGGLPEVAGDGGIVLPIPVSVTPEDTAPPPPASVRQWADAIIRLHDDPAAYQAARDRARAGSARFDPAALSARRAEFFRTVQPATAPVVRPVPVGTPPSPQPAA